MPTHRLVKRAIKARSTEIQECCSLSNELAAAQGLKFAVKHNGEIKKGLRDEVWKIWLDNMLETITNSSSGYNSKEKLKEMFNSLSRFILVFKDERLIGFALFRFEDEDDERLLYCYELQMHEDFRGKGIAFRLMQCLEAIGKEYEMEKLILTSWKVNEMAMKFYLKFGLEIDETSPSKFGEEVDYEILSKPL